jgi:hypothetical protein
MTVETWGFLLVGLGILVLFAVGLSRPRRKSPLKAKPAESAPPLEDEEELHKELDRLFAKPVPEQPKPHKLAPFARALGVIARIAIYGGIAWAIWTFYPPPKDIFEIPLAQLKIGDIFRTIFYVMIFAGLGRLFFDFPDEDNDSAWELWEGLGVIGTFVAALCLLAFLIR